MAMLTVEWSDYKAPGGPSQRQRTGKLLQIARGKVDGRDGDVAYVITENMPWDGQSHLGKVKVIHTVKLEYIIVKGVEVPLFS